MTSSRTAEVLAEPLGAVDTARLVFTRGASHLTIGVDGSMDDLYRARFDGKVPHVSVDGGTVTVKYRPSLRPPRGEITLSGRIPWAIRAHMGMSDVVADLKALELADLEISGGTSKITVRLPRPNDAVRVRIGAGASNLELVRPAGVAVRVRIGGGGSKLAIDDFSVDAAGGRTDWRSPDYDVAEGRYDIEIGAGASKITVRT
ncbi:MAG TPA: hypothetical protein VK964_17330 [Nocardioidaceae bacterium]|nr:hypothetical protein [Nocardioidaceae bacterium]